MENREHIKSNKKLPKQDQSNFKRDEEIEEGSDESEINPNKLNREQTKTDQNISENSKAHQPYELSQGSNNLGVSGGAGGAQFGQGSNSLETQGRRNGIAKGNEPENHERLLGQGGYGTKQEGSQSTKGTYDTSLRGSNGGVDGVRSGKGSGKFKKNK